MAKAYDSKIRNLEDFAGIASDWFWETDAEHRFTYFSSRMAEVTKMPPDDIIGKRRDAITQEGINDKKWARHLADLRAHRPFRNLEYTLKRPTDDSTLWVRVSGQPLFDDSGAFVGYRGTGHNVTEEMETMRRLKASNAALEDRNRELDEARSAIQRTADEDALTRLANRRAFERDLASAMSDQPGGLALLHVDLDRFKLVNDTLGHPAGDAVLMVAAERIEHAAGGKNTVYRVGGDEFMVILTDNVTHDRAMWIADSIVETMRQPIQLDTKRTTIGASVGVAFAEPGKVTASQLVAYADVALYEAKRGGRNAVCEIAPTMQARMEQRRQLAADMPGALARREFIPFFQPQVDTDTNMIVGAEALVRWQHPRLGMLPPGAFLGPAAELGLAGQIDKLVLEETLAAVGRLSKQGFALPSVSVNISEARLHDPGLADDVDRLWSDRSFSLSIELLETIYFDDTGESHQFSTNLRRLRAMGVWIETDDFGSGRASITGLLKVWPDRLKIDRGLVQAVIKDPTKRSLVAAILDMARALHIDSIAEGVECQEDIAALRALGCRTFQGYAISHPLSEADFATFLDGRVLGACSKTKTAGPRGLPKTA